jgi:hypothetical protein
VTASETPAQKLLALQQRWRELKRPPRPTNPWQANFHTFLTEKVWSQDESRGGVIRQIDDAQYIRELCDALIEEHLLFVEKSRRVLASWIVCAWDLWVAAGGQDERWPALMQSTGNRQVVLQALKLEDAQGAAWFMKERIRFMYDEAVRRGLRNDWPSFPTFTWTYSEARGSNGSRINALPQGEDKARGLTCTLYHGEEVGMWTQAKGTVEGAKPTILPYGHMVLVSTPKVGTYAAALRHGELR